MPGGAVVVGDRERILAFRLLGALARAPLPGATTGVVRIAEESAADLLLLTPERAAELDPGLLAAMRRRGRPLVLVLPGAQAARFDVRPQIRRALGLET